MRDKLEHNELNHEGRIACTCCHSCLRYPHKYHKSRQGRAGKQKQRCARAPLMADEQVDMLSAELEDITVGVQHQEDGTL